MYQVMVTGSAFPTALMLSMIEPNPEVTEEADVLELALDFGLAWALTLEFAMGLGCLEGFFSGFTDFFLSAREAKVPL